jgi:class 3 adenylate cyclase/predicted ATPase
MMEDNLPAVLNSIDLYRIISMKFYEILINVTGRLVFEQRLSYLALRRDLGLNDVEIQDVRTELLFRGVARDEDNKGLVWTGALTTREPKWLDEVRLPPKSDLQESTVLVASTPERTQPAPLISAERRQLTVMFCDLVGSTTLSGKLDPEDWREVVRAYQETAASVIHQYEGHIAQYLGDGLLVYLGYPQAHEDDAQRAVFAGLGIASAMEALNHQLQTKYGVELAVRIGIHTGPVVVGQMGGDGRHEQLALGETPNVAARLEALALPNTIVISQATLRLVSDTFVLETLGRQTLKGAGEPIEVWRVMGLRVYEQSTESAPRHDAVHLIGREAEITLLRQRWEHSKTVRGQVVLISGEAGIGKSSLVNAMRSQAEQEGFPRVTFRCSPYHRNSALYPVAVHIRQLLGLDREADSQVKLTALERRLKPYEHDIKNMVQLFAMLLSIPVPEDRYPGLNISPKQQREQTLEALSAWLLAEAQRQPVLVLWEDIHWADPTTLELLGLLVDRAPSASILALLTFRPDFVALFPMRSHITTVMLNRLEAAQAQAIMARLTSGKHLPPEVIAHIASRADGVPLYVEELTKALLESDLLQEQDDHYRLTRPLSDMAIPMTLQDSLMARLDRAPAVREVAQLGAVIGREFSYEMLHALSVIEEKHLQQGLAKLVDSELIHQRGQLRLAKYVFKHALVQDAAYQSMLRRTRQHYHQRCAQVMESNFTDLVKTEPELVAYHYTEAGCAAESVAYWLQAGQRAAQRLAHHEAIAHLTKGLEVLATQASTPAGAQQEFLLNVTLGVSIAAVKGYAASELSKIYTRAQELSQQVAETPQHFQAVRGLVLYYLVRGQTQPALELAQQLVEQGERQTEVGLKMLSRYHLGMALFQRGVVAEAAQHYEQAKSMYVIEQHRGLANVYGIDLGVTTRGFYSLPMWILGYPDRALALGQEALTFAQDLGHPFSLVFAQCWLAWLHQYRQEADAAHEHATIGINLATGQGLPLYRAWGAIAQGWALTQQGQATEGIVLMQKGIETANATGADVYRPYFLSLLAEALNHTGEWESGLRLLDEAVEAVDRTGERFYEAELYRLKGDLTLKADKAASTAQAQSQAEAFFINAISIAQSQQAKSFELRAAMSLARLWQSQRKKSKAHKLLSGVYHWFTEGFGTKDLQAAKELMTELARKSTVK